MKRIRIGKDISMRWEITTDGVAIPLEGRDLTIEIKSPAGIGNNIPYRVDGNILIMTFYGYEQKRTGEYSITLWENKGKIGQNVVDVVRAFELVRTSQEENDFVGGDLQIESVDLGTENFDILTEGGYRAINIDTLHAEALEDSVNIKGKTYSNESFTITLPKANLDSAGVMSASDVRTLKEHADSIAQFKTSCEENAADIERVSNVVDTHESRLGSIDAEISSLNTEVPTLQSKVDENTTSISQINNNIADNNKSIAKINTTLEEHTESINSKITTDRIEDGAVTSEKISTSAFDGTLSVSGKIAPADVVGGKLNELEANIKMPIFCFNKINPDYLQLNKNVTDEGVIGNFAGRMIYAISLNNNVTKISTNAYKVFFYKDGIFQKLERGNNGPIQIIPGEADNIILLMIDQRENVYYLYFNSDVSQYYDFGDTENFIDLSKKAKDLEDEISGVQNDVIKLNEEIDKVKIEDLISDIAQITPKGHIGISDGYYTGKVENNNRSIVSVNISNGSRINFTAKSDTDYPLYAIVDSTNKVLLSENATKNGQIKSIEINLLEYPTGTKLLYCIDFRNPNVNGYLYYNNKLLIEVEEIKKDVESHTEQISDIQKKLGSVLYKIGVTENSVIQLGRGYIKNVDGTIDVNSTLEGVGNANNRRALKIDVSKCQKIENLYVKSDANYFMYVLCDESGNILKEEKGTKAGDAKYIDIDITQYPDAKWLLSCNDYNNPIYSGFIYYDTDLANDIIKLTEDVEKLNEENDLAKYNLVTEYFQVRVNTKRSENNIATQNDYISENYDNDNCYFALPNNVKKDTKLIIVCHGGGQLIGTNNETTNEFIRRCVIDTFRALGYATLATNGMPDLWASEKGLEDSSAPIGNWMALESIVKAYEYVMNKYSFLDSNGCYIWASSQGGMVAENVVELSNIPFKACCYEAPAISMRYVQLYLTYRIPWIQALYGFDSVETYDKNKCLGLDPFIRNISEDIPVDGTTFAEIAINGGLENLVSKKYRKISPLLIQQGMTDGAVSPIITQAYIKAIQNAGNLAEFKGYEGIGHGVSSLTTKYSMQGFKPTPLYTTTGLLDCSKWFYRYGGYSIPAGKWGNATE